MLELLNIAGRRSLLAFAIGSALLFSWPCLVSAQDAASPPSGASATSYDNEPSVLPDVSNEQLMQTDQSIPLPAREDNISSETTQPAAGVVDEGENAAVAETQRRLRYQFSLLVREVYDDNINLSQVRPISDFYTSIEPTLRLALGEIGEQGNNSLEFIYAPSALIYADHSEANAIQQLIRLQAQRVFGKLTASVTGDVRLLNGVDLRSLTDTTGRAANVDVGRRTRHNDYDADLTLSYILSGKTFLTGGIDYARSDYLSTALNSFQTVSGNLFLNYNYSPKLVLGAGVTGGYNETDRDLPTQYFEQGRVRVNYNPGDKLGFVASVGVEAREFSSGSEGTYVSPVFDLSGNFKPFDGTTISIGGSRRTQNSAAIAGSDYAETDIHFSVQQRFFQRISVTVSAGYRNLDYFSVFNQRSIGRSDNYYYSQLAVDGNITRFWDAGIYYLHREDASSVDAYTFSDNQVGLRSSVSF